MTTLAQERKREKLTQHELSIRSGVPQAFISDIENGVTKNPRIETLRRLSAILGFDIAELQIVVDGMEEERNAV